MAIRSKRMAVRTLRTSQRKYKEHYTHGISATGITALSAPRFRAALSFPSEFFARDVGWRKLKANEAGESSEAPYGMNAPERPDAAQDMSRPSSTWGWPTM